MKLKIRLRALAAAAALLCAQTLSAQQWTLEQCIAYALQNNIDIQRKRVSVLEAKALTAQAFLALLPEVGLDATHSFNWGRAVNLQDLTITRNELTRTSTASAGASMVLFSGLTLVNNIRDKKFLLKGRELECKALSDQINISITKAYLEIMLAGQMLRTASESLAGITGQRDRTAILVEVGAQPWSALLDMESQVASERVQQAACQSRLATAELALRQLLDLPVSSQFSVVTPQLDSVPPFSGEDIESIFASAGSLAQVETARAALSRSRAQLALAHGEASPTLTVGASYGTYCDHTGTTRDWKDQFKENHNPAVGITLRIPILSRGAHIGAIRSASLAVEDARLALQSRQQELLKEIQSAVTDAEGYYHQWLAAERNVQAMEESMRIVTEKFESGAVSSTDYIVARSNLIEALSTCHQAKWQYVFQLKIIDFYKGKKLTL